MADATNFTALFPPCQEKGTNISLSIFAKKPSPQPEYLSEARNMLSKARTDYEQSVLDLADYQDPEKNPALRDVVAPKISKKRIFLAAAAAGLAAAFAPPRRRSLNTLGKGTSPKPVYGRYLAHNDQREDENPDAFSKLKQRSRIGLPAIGSYGSK